MYELRNLIGTDSVNVYTNNSGGPSSASSAVCSSPILLKSQTATFEDSSQTTVQNPWYVDLNRLKQEPLLKTETIQPEISPASGIRGRAASSSNFANPRERQSEVIKNFQAGKGIHFICWSSCQQKFIKRIKAYAICLPAMSDNGLLRFLRRSRIPATTVRMVLFCENPSHH